jgi:Domain of unknown function (DUF4190)
MTNDPNQYPPQYPPQGYTPPPGYTPAPGYEQPPAQPYGYPPQGYPQYAQQAPMPVGTNGLAIASLICAFIFPLVGVILGHIALNQIKQTGQEGRGLAIAGLVIGYAYIGITLLVVCFVLVVSLATVNTNSSGFPPLLAG